MKKIYFLLLTLSCYTLSAQTDVQLHINHLLGTDPFSYGTTQSNNLGHDFNLSRLQYYISDIKLEHDGGVITDVSDYWILADAGIDETHELGSYNITTLEAIHFAIGVDSAHNHLDPSQYAMIHPLAPKAPSMHWGWESGYIFLVYDGNKGSGMSEVFEIHSLDDKYYYHQRIPTAGEDISGDLLITLNADYLRIADSIDFSLPVIDHGNLPNNIRSLQNTHNYVFKSHEGNGNTNTLPTTGTPELGSEDASVLVYPNPAADGSFTVEVTGRYNTGYTVEVVDMTGKTIKSVKPFSSGNRSGVTLEENGLYMVLIRSGENTIASKRVMVNKK